MAQNILCIVGTGTDAGKTVVTAGLLRAAHRRSIACAALKPVQTGCETRSDGVLLAPDVAVYQEACPEAPARALFTLKAACSPPLAALSSGLGEKGLPTASALASVIFDYACLPENQDRLILIEGAGGLFTPLNREESFLDLLIELNAPILLTAANTLGSINQTLLSLQALRNRGLSVAGFVFSSPCPDREDTLHEEALPQARALSVRIREDNKATITRLSGVSCLAELPFLPSLQARESVLRACAWDEVANILDPVLPALLNRVFGREDCQKNSQDVEEMERCLQFDREHIWHPYTSALAPLRCREAVRTEGCRIFLRDGTELVDGMASWWCAIHGYRHPRLLNALYEQAGRMPHVMFGGLTHRPAVDLAQKLLGLAPDNLAHVFFSDSGSTAVEVAMKMAVQYQKAQGRRQKSTLLTIRGGYHGDTLGAMSVCDPQNGMHALFTGLLPAQIFAERPDCAFSAPYDPLWAEGFRQLLSEHAHEVAAVILEPIVQGAGGMWIYHPECLRQVREICNEQGCLLILDEIATGFGRTGRLFACDWAGVQPDILCLGKALTGGVMTLAATLASGEVARGISRSGGVLMHGPTFMANPLACAVARASLEIVEEGLWRDQVARIEGILTRELAACKELPGVADVRILGAIGVVEMEHAVDVEQLQDFFVQECGVWLRPFGRLIYTMPPYVMSSTDLERVCRAVTDAVRLQQGNSAWASS